MLEVVDLVVRYGAATALHGVSLRVEEGHVVVLIGVNGAGKTTLLRAISGLVRPAHGEVRLGDLRITGLPPYRVTRLGVVHVPEGRHVFPDLTVAENLAMGGFIYRHARREFQEALTLVYDLFPRLADRRHQLAGTLSGGEQQMLSLGRALMSRPKLLLLDEPSMGLAPQLVWMMFDFLRDLHARTRLTILLVEQLANLALELADRAYVLEQGRIVLEGTGAELRQSPKVQAVYLGAMA
jgi:branched-chain amino acid transport system ATP-binding protein